MDFGQRFFGAGGIVLGLGCALPASSRRDGLLVRLAAVCLRNTSPVWEKRNAFRDLLYLPPVCAFSVSQR